MITEVLQFLRNWFVERGLVADIAIVDGELASIDGSPASDYLREGDYYRLINSRRNSGVHKFGAGGLTDEELYCGIWILAIPQALLDLIVEIEEWQTKHGTAAASPFSSESFGGYSYSKGSGTNGDTSWQSAFLSRLTPWRKI